MSKQDVSVLMSPELLDLRAGDGEGAGRWCSVDGLGNSSVEAKPLQNKHCFLCLNSDGSDGLRWSGASFKANSLQIEKFVPGKRKAEGSVPGFLVTGAEVFVLAKKRLNPRA